MTAKLWASMRGFISYYPLKQGLKLQMMQYEAARNYIFISYYPLKQGLKLEPTSGQMLLCALFISYYPLKQGLKHVGEYPHTDARAVFTLLSIKTRIETDSAS